MSTFLYFSIFHLTHDYQRRAVDLTWTDVSATPYTVYRDDTQLTQASNTHFTDQTVEAGNTYTYTVSGNGTPESGSVIINIPNNNSSGGGTDPPQPQPPSFPLILEAESDFRLTNPYFQSIVKVEIC